MELKLLDHVVFYAEAGDDRSMRWSSIAPHRGAITRAQRRAARGLDAGRQHLVNPQELNDTRSLPKLAKALKEDQSGLRGRYHHQS